jgi:3-hydroxyisobutyrate dehydrogenase-like beta-hydroxyacid dehydrogenase
MALNLLRAGHEIRVFNRTPAKATKLAEAGATIAKSPFEAAEGVDAAITMLANDQAVREIMLAPVPPTGAVIDVLRRGAIHVCTSTISVALSKELTQEHSRRGQGHVAAPVLGRPEAAAERKLWVIVAGPRDHVERCRPLIEALGRGFSIMGDQPWQANITKIAANFMLASMLEAMGESFALLRKMGMDTHAFVEVLNALFNSPVYANYGRIIADRRFVPAGFSLRLGLKDVGLALEAAQDAAVPMQLASLVRDHYLSAVAHGLENADWSALAEVAAQDAGLVSGDAESSMNTTG